MKSKMQIFKNATVTKYNNKRLVIIKSNENTNHIVVRFIRLLTKEEINNPITSIIDNHNCFTQYNKNKTKGILISQLLLTKESLNVLSKAALMYLDE